MTVCASQIRPLRLRETKCLAQGHMSWTGELRSALGLAEASNFDRIIRLTH